MYNEYDGQYYDGGYNYNYDYDGGRGGGIGDYMWYIIGGIGGLIVLVCIVVVIYWFFFSTSSSTSSTSSTSNSAPSRKTPWELSQGGLLLRLNDMGITECASKNSKDCIWNTVDPDLFADPSKVPSQLTCGRDHRSKWEFTGYEPNSTHWCSNYARDKGIEIDELNRFHLDALAGR
jgi:hypothetical protein